MKIKSNGAWILGNPNRHTVSNELCHEIISLIKAKEIKSSVDLGCGNGRYVEMIREAGFPCDGFDGSPLTEEMTGGLAKTLDLSKEINVGEYDLVISLEVGEHIPSKFEDIFLDNLTKTAKSYVILSWAVEGQKGTGHVNCRNNDWVVSKMQDRGFRLTDDFFKFRDAVIGKKFGHFKNTILTFEKGKI